MIEGLSRLYFFNLAKDVSPFLVEAVAILSSVLAGLAIGWEREKAGKPAGIRTFAIVCLGSTLFTLLARELNTPESMSRIIGQIISGIGFIGAGAVFRAEEKISGLTTAAGIWVSSAVGVIFGLGYLPFGAVISVFVVVLFRLQRRAELLIYGPCDVNKIEVTFRDQGNRNLVKVMSALEHDKRLNLRFVKSEDVTLSKFTIDVCSRHRNHRHFLRNLADFDFITNINPQIHATKFNQN